ncbi:hypothetical protein E4T56_gene5107 [Termitomyces sp. T112]|nr:hypothetical protein E4T56_gene5107 [Termitomyces sp. T112]
MVTFSRRSGNLDTLKITRENDRTLHVPVTNHVVRTDNRPKRPTSSSCDNSYALKIISNLDDDAILLKGLAFVVYWGIVLFGYDNGIASGVVTFPYLQAQFGLNDQNHIDNVSSNVVSVLQVGAFFGSLKAHHHPPRSAADVRSLHLALSSLLARSSPPSLEVKVA